MSSHLPMRLIQLGQAAEAWPSAGRVAGRDTRVVAVIHPRPVFLQLVGDHESRNCLQDTCFSLLATRFQDERGGVGVVVVSV